MLPTSNPRRSSSNDVTHPPSTFETIRSAPPQKREGTETRLLNQAERGENTLSAATTTRPQDLRRSTHHASRYPSRLPGPSTPMQSVGSQSRPSSLGASSCATGLNGLRQQAYSPPTGELQASIDRQGQVTRKRVADLSAVSEDGSSKKSRKSAESLPWLRPRSPAPGLPGSSSAPAPAAASSVGDVSEGSDDTNMSGPLANILNRMTGPLMDIAGPKSYAGRERRTEAHVFGMLRGAPSVRPRSGMVADGRENQEETEVAPRGGQGATSVSSPSLGTTERKHPRRPERAVLRDTHGSAVHGAENRTIPTDGTGHGTRIRNAPGTKSDPEVESGFLSAIAQRFPAFENPFSRPTKTPSNTALVPPPSARPLSEEPKETAPQEEKTTTTDAAARSPSTWSWYQVLFTALFFLSSGISLMLLLFRYKASLRRLSSSLQDWGTANLRAVKSKQGGTLDLLDISNDTLTMRINQTLRAGVVSTGAANETVFNLSYNATIAGLRNLGQGASLRTLPMPSFSAVFLVCVLVCGVYLATFSLLRWLFGWAEGRWSEKTEWGSEAAICFLPIWRGFIKWRGVVAVVGAALLACGLLAGVLRAYLRGLQSGG